MSDREYIDFKKLKSRVSMGDILDHYGLTETLERKNDHTLVGPCPITGSTNSTAFKVNEEKQVWYSFALEDDGAGGNILDFVVRMEDTDLVGAANLINDWFEADEQAAESGEDVDQEAREEETPTEQLDIYETFVNLCGDEVDRIEDGARNDILDALESIDQLDEDDREEVADRVSRWVLRAYKRGYKLGKMQGQIDERVDRLD